MQLHNVGGRNVRRKFGIGLLVALFASPAMAGPPYVTDDPQPTPYGKYEIYAFTSGTKARDGTGGEAGIDFNYGGAPNLQLTAVVPLDYDAPASGDGATGVGRIELAAKYKFLHQEDIGWDVALFPRVFLSSASSVGAHHTSLFVPLFVQHDWGKWSTFGGGGCTLNHSRSTQNFCQMGWVLAREFAPGLQLGLELYHQTADIKGGTASTGIGAGVVYDVNESLHLIGSFGPGIQNASENNQLSWYTAALFTF